MTEQEKNLHSGHRERLRERYKAGGPDSFQDHELLELLLHFSIAQKDTNPIGHELIRHFGNLQGVFEADEKDLIRVAGMGERSVFLLKLISGLTRRYLDEINNGDLQLNEIADRVKFFIPRFIGHTRECLYAAFLNQNFKLIECSLQYVGSIDAVEIHVTKIVGEAIRSGAKYVILAHNHFNDSIPSNQDIFATRALHLALDPHKIKLLDHIIVCGTGGTSMKESGHFAKAVY